MSQLERTSSFIVYRYFYFFVFVAAFFFDATKLTVDSSSSAAGSETLIGIKGRDFVLLATSSGLSGNGGVAFTSTYLDKIHVFQPSYTAEDANDSSASVIVPTIAIAAGGNYADVDHLTRRIRAEYDIYHYESLTYSSTTTTATATTTQELEIIDCRSNSISNHDCNYDHDSDLDHNTVLSVDQIVHMVRNQIMSKLRSPYPYRICTLIAGLRPRTQQQPFDGVDDDDNNSDDDGTTTGLAEHLQQQVRIATSNRMFPNDNPSQNHRADVSGNGDHNANDPICTNDRTVESPYEPILYWLDEYGSMIDNIPYGVHGYASDMMYSILDQNYHSALSKEQAVQLLNQCIQQLQTRYTMNTQQQQQQQSSSHPRKSFCIKLIDQYGCTVL